MFRSNAQRGSALYISFMIMVALMGIALGVSTIAVSQLGVLKGIGYSVLAFYATDAGVERALYIDNTTCLEAQDHASCLASEFANLAPDDLILSNGAAVELFAETPSSLSARCLGDAGYSHCVKATGSYKESRRAVRVTRRERSLNSSSGAIETPHGHMISSAQEGTAPPLFTLRAASSFDEPQEGVRLSVEDILGATTDSGWVYVADTTVDNSGTTFWAALMKNTDEVGLLYGVTDVVGGTYTSNIIGGQVLEVSDTASYMASYSKVSDGTLLFRVAQIGTSTKMRLEVNVPWPSLADPQRRYVRDEVFSLNAVIWKSGDGVIPMTKNVNSWYLSFVFDKGLWVDVQKFNAEGASRFLKANHYWGSFILTADTQSGLPAGTKGVWVDILDANDQRQPGFTGFDLHTGGQQSSRSDFTLTALETFAGADKIYLKKARLVQQDFGVDIIFETVLPDQEFRYPFLPSFYEGAVRIIDPATGAVVGTGMLEQTHSE